MIYLLIPFAAALFALFPLTDTDIWWHLACGREWVVTWTPMREGLLNIHAYFQQFVFAIYSLGGAPLLVLIKCVLWFFVFFLFVLPSTKRKNHLLPITLFVLLLFVCRFLLEMRPVVISMICLGVIWKIVPRMHNRRSFFVGGIVLLLMQWFWCRFQGLFVLGPILCAIIFFTNFKKVQHVRAKLLLCLAMLLVPLLHEGGLAFLRYPLELFDRLVGLSSESEIFSSAIAENRSPLTLLLKGENLINSLLMIVCCVESVVLGIYTALRKKSEDLYNLIVEKLL